MSIKEANTFSKKQNEQKRKDIELKIKENDKQIKLNDKEIELREEAFQLQIKHPKPINPNYEFETTEEFSKHLVKQWQFNHDKQMDFLRESQERLKKQNKEMEKQLKKGE